LTDDEIGLNETLTAGKVPSVPWTGPGGHTCSTDWADYGSDGTYTDTAKNLAKIVGSSGQSAEDDATTEYTCEAGKVDVLKTTRGSVDPSYPWTFVLYEGPDGFGGTEIGSSSTSDTDVVGGVLDFGEPALPIDETYTVCELGDQATVNWYSEWETLIDGEIINIEPYNPNADDQTPEDLGNRCVDIGAGTPYPLSVGETLRLEVDNKSPEGEARTPGYWKNWNACSNGNQFSKTTDDVDPENEFWSLEEALGLTYDPETGEVSGEGFTWGALEINTCPIAVTLLNKSALDELDGKKGKGTKTANDAAYNLATALLAYQLNISAGVPTCQAAEYAEGAALDLLIGLGFDGKENYLLPAKGKAPDDPRREEALDLMGTLDAFNNNILEGCN